MTNNIYFIANWKMYGNIESIKTIKNVISLSKKRSLKNVKIIYCPPYTLLSEFVKKTKKSSISVGAQNCHQHSSFGSFTGSINSLMVKNIGCEYIILGHSENRKIGDTDKVINTKIRSALKANLKIIFCIGETLKEKKNKQTKKILKNQIIKGLKGIKFTLACSGLSILAKAFASSIESFIPSNITYSKVILLELFTPG